MKDKTAFKIRAVLGEAVVTVDFAGPAEAVAELTRFADLNAFAYAISESGEVLSPALLDDLAKAERARVHAS